MLDRVSKIIYIIAGTLAIVVILIGGVAWAIRLETDLRGVQADVADLRLEVAELRRDMDEVKENQRLILQALEGLHAAIANHTHNADGRAPSPPHLLSATGSG